LAANRFRGARFAPLLVFVLAASAPDLALAQAGEAKPKWGSSIDFEAKPGTKRSLGEADLFVPLWQDPTTLFFGNLRARLDDDNGREGNIGLGLRRMMDAGWNLGGYAYYDRRRTEHGNSFNQATFGAEALSVPLSWTELDLRGNVYVPFGDRADDAGTSGSSASIVNDTIQVSTFVNEERALRGFDAEVGFRVPLWPADDDKALRIYAGGYYFDSGTTDAVAGPRLRTELAMYRVPGLWDGARLTLGAEYQHDDERGHQGFGLARLRIPLQFFASENSGRLTPQERRMTDPVVRDVDIVSVESPRNAPAIVETATQTTNGQALTLITPAIADSLNIPPAIANAGANSVVLMQGNFQLVNTTIDLQPGQTLMAGGSVGVRTPSGRTATLTTSTVTLSGVPGNGLVSPAVRMADNSTLTGFTFQRFAFAGDNSVVHATGVSGATIVNNTLRGGVNAGGTTSVGVLINGGSSNITVRNNILRGETSTGDGFGVQIENSSATVSGNTFILTGPGTNNTASLTNAVIGAGSTGNISNSGSCVNGGGNTGSIGFTNVASCP
jgi:hypothetical protein